MFTLLAPRQEAPLSTEQNVPEDQETVVEETLVEEVSIDGMCGVY